jgi:hypothetical protein
MAEPQNCYYNTHAYLMLHQEENQKIIAYRSSSLSSAIVWSKCVQHAPVHVGRYWIVYNTTLFTGCLFSIGRQHPPSPVFLLYVNLSI